MVKIRITSKKLKSIWDLQTAKKVLEICGLSSDVMKGITQKELKVFEEKITIYLWENIQKQFPQINKFCKGYTGGFNKIEDKNFKTPIINIYGSFYMQLITLNDRNNWVWQAIELEPYRFEFNQEGYFKGLVVDAINKAIIEGYAKKETFKNLINALNENKTQESIITIKTQGKNLGNVDLNKVDTTIN